MNSSGRYHSKRSDSLPYRFDPEAEYSKKSYKAMVTREKRKLDPALARELNRKTRLAREQRRKTSEAFDPQLHSDQDIQHLEDLDPHEFYENIDEVIEDEDCYPAPPTDQQQHELEDRLGALVNQRKLSNRLGSYTKMNTGQSLLPASKLIHQFGNSGSSLSEITATINPNDIIHTQGPFDLLPNSCEIEKQATSGKLAFLNSIHMELYPETLAANTFKPLPWWEKKITSLGGSEPCILDMKCYRDGMLIMTHQISNGLKVCCALEVTNSGKLYILHNYAFISLPISTPGNIPMIEFTDFVEQQRKPSRRRK